MQRRTITTLRLAQVPGIVGTKEAKGDLARVRSAGGRLLDLGCGHGRLLYRARKDGWDVKGVELSTETAARVRARVQPGHAHRARRAQLERLMGEASERASV